MTDSILNSIKESLGLTADYAPFDQEMLMHINSVFSDLNQLGIGPASGFSITSSNEVWADFFGTITELAGYEELFNNVKTYMSLRVKRLFDPPSVGFVLTAQKEEIEKLEWRINVARENIVHPYVPPVVPAPYDPFA